MQAERANIGAAPQPPWIMVDGGSPIVATAIHDGHDLRPELDALVSIEEEERRREEDPLTGFLAEVAPTRVIVNRSRFEVDLNRPLDESVCVDPEDCWGVALWDRPPPDHILDGSRRLHQDFYAALYRLLTKAWERHGRFVVLDLHSYNHRRSGPEGPPDAPTGNPDVNVGTGSLDRDAWGSVVDRFITDLSAHELRLDVRENVKFRGRQLAAWTNERFSGRGCCLAIEFKKTFMDEWTGRVEGNRLLGLRGALAATLPALEEELQRL